MAQSGKFKRTLVASGAAALLSAGALGAPSALADSTGPQAGGTTTTAQPRAMANDTPDGYAWEAYIQNHRYANVIWDDYTSDGADVDSLTIDDTNFDGYSSELRVYKSNGNLYKKVHAYNGGTKTIQKKTSNGGKAYFRVCGWNNGAQKGCTGKHYFRE
ncbi:hypothetical protein IM697_23995 [Streptomyces ferrugineus]|uniref:Uncharacterized protein n=1 Tax=Streptomyces ferrugineus TaxID=1413221 RepID=A0A7M2SAA5_9ACTN|nr:hypothetical protein [Streptomyces ferrugineus]QOV33297.1 hypothetical protein IM697_23995 [Streptomyces ferrugineus]